MKIQLLLEKTSKDQKNTWRVVVRYRNTSIKLDKVYHTRDEAMHDYEIIWTAFRALGWPESVVI